MFDYRKDLTAYSDQELALNVMNDEYFYNEREDKRFLMALIDEQFIYTKEQLKELNNQLSEVTQ
tara:strand:+ start:37123 stop:37314 length:192 start_codon:yes stop_codon:yes gene_type:complete